VAGEAPAPDHGDTDVSPMPDPSAASMKETAMAATAPPMIAAQDMAETADSRVLSATTTPAAGPPGPEARIPGGNVMRFFSGCL
jgi:hypothetical protein